MKKVALVIITLLAMNSYSQEVKNQTEHIKSLRTGKYITYDVNGKGQWYPIRLKAELAAVESEKNFSEHKILKFKIGNSMHDKPESYLPDNMAFPITMAKIAYEGNTKMQKKVGYVPRKIRKGSTNRVVVLDGVIYDLSFKFDGENPETFKPYRLYVHESFVKQGSSKKEKPKKKKLSFFKKMTTLQTNVSADLGSKKLADMKVFELVKDYLTKAYAAQKKAYPSWKSETKNKLRLESIELKRKLMNKAMNDYNEAYKKSDEWKRIQENNRRANAAAQKNNTTIQNKTGRDIYVYEEGSHNGSRINVGSSGTFSCNETYYYSFSGNVSWREGRPINGASCGSTATVK